MRNEALSAVNEVVGQTKARGQRAEEWTTARFMSELSAIRHMFSWTVTKRGRIRGSILGDKSRSFDPLTAVAYVQTGEAFPEGRWAAAAATMHLRYSDCGDLVAAFNYDWDPSCRQGILRHDLLAVLISHTDSPEKASRLNSVFSTFAKTFRNRLATPSH